MKKGYSSVKMVELPEGVTHYVPVPKRKTTVVRFDLGSQVFDVCCRQNPDGTYMLEVEGSGELRVRGMTPEVVYIEPIPFDNC